MGDLNAPQEDEAAGEHAKTEGDDAHSKTIAAQISSILLEALPMELLSCRQSALLMDTCGLLDGVANGVITRGQSRIRDNLVEIYSLFDKDSVKIDQTVLRTAFLHALDRSAGAGITVEGFNLASRRQWRNREGRQLE